MPTPKKFVFVLIAATLLALAPGQLYASTIVWYNGDFDGVNGLSNEVNTSVSQAYVYDDFLVPVGGWTLTGAFTNDLMNTTFADTADVEIRSGVSAGNGGTLVYGAYGVAATKTATGRSGFGFDEFTIQVSLPNVVLAPNTYWLMVAPVGSADGRSFVSTTSGANCIGLPCGNNQTAYFTSSFFGTNFVPTSEEGQPFDFSMGLIGDAGQAPEPTSLLLLGTGGLGLVARLRRRKQRQS